MATFVQEHDSINLFGLTQNQLTDFLISLGQKPYHAKQLLRCLYQKGVVNFAQISHLPKALVAKLAQTAYLKLPDILSCHQSSDGTIKWLIAVDGYNQVEMVYIPKGTRGTLCISSQVGCALSCAFCQTAQVGFNRNLTAAEMVGQVLLANATLKGQHRQITNVVFMGMGEPLLNEQALYNSCDLLLDDFAFALSRHKITISSAGVVPAIYRLSDRLSVNLAISLHAAEDDLRNQLVTINQKYPIAQLLDACRYYLQSAKQKRHIFFEYVMLSAVNDSKGQAKLLAKLLASLPKWAIKINLIPFNPFVSTSYKPSSVKIIKTFQDILQRQGLRTTIRQTRGDDIIAACGQLVGQVKNKKKVYAEVVDI